MRVSNLQTGLTVIKCAWLEMFLCKAFMRVARICMNFQLSVLVGHNLFFDVLLSTFYLLQEPRKKIKETGGSSLKRKEIESDGESPPRKTAVHRRKAIVFDSDEEWVKEKNWWVVFLISSIGTKTGIDSTLCHHTSNQRQVIHYDLKWTALLVCSFLLVKWSYCAHMPVQLQIRKINVYPIQIQSALWNTSPPGQVKYKIWALGKSSVTTWCIFLVVSCSSGVDTGATNWRWSRLWWEDTSHCLRFTTLCRLVAQWSVYFTLLHHFYFKLERAGPFVTLWNLWTLNLSTRYNGWTICWNL